MLTEETNVCLLSISKKDTTVYLQFKDKNKNEIKGTAKIELQPLLFEDSPNIKTQEITRWV